MLRHTTIISTSDKAEPETSTGQEATHTTDKHTNPTGGFEAAIPASERAQTHALAQPLGSAFYRHIESQSISIHILYATHSFRQSHSFPPIFNCCVVLIVVLFLTVVLF